MLAALHARALLRFRELVADVLDQHRAVLAADAQHLGLVDVEIQAHHARVRSDFLLRLFVIFQGVDLDMPDILWFLLLRTD